MSNKFSFRCGKDDQMLSDFLNRKNNISKFIVKTLKNSPEFKKYIKTISEQHEAQKIQKELNKLSLKIDSISSEVLSNNPQIIEHPQNEIKQESKDEKLQRLELERQMFARQVREIQESGIQNNSRAELIAKIVELGKEIENLNNP